jgi:hypothetical protein
MYLSMPLSCQFLEHKCFELGIDDTPGETDGNHLEIKAAGEFEDVDVQHVSYLLGFEQEQQGSESRHERGIDKYIVPTYEEPTANHWGFDIILGVSSYQWLDGPVCTPLL